MVYSGQTPSRASSCQTLSPLGWHLVRIQAHTIPLAIALLSALLSLGITPMQGAAQTSETFPANPLETTEPDPLLPTPLVERPLSPQELADLARAVDQLQQEAEATYATGDVDGAFEIWNRELRLRRALGPQAEAAALGRVGGVAWQENRTLEVRAITDRLQEIEQEAQAQPPADFDLLLTIARAYQTLRARNAAIATFEEILVEARQRQNQAVEQEALTAVGDLHLAYFDYTSAAAAYQELLTLAQARGDRPLEVQYLEQLAYIYQRSANPEAAIAVLERLVSFYEADQTLIRIPPLKIAIGDSYRQLSRPDLAARSYEEAFTLAQSDRQYAYASDALQHLADLYQSLDRLEDALVVYRLLVDVERQSYSVYGMMSAYDQIGQIHRSLGNNGQALDAFQRGLELATQLSYNESYFASQIQDINQPPTESDPIQLEELRQPPSQLEELLPLLEL